MRLISNTNFKNLDEILLNCCCESSVAPENLRRLFQLEAYVKVLAEGKAFSVGLLFNVEETAP